MKNLVVKIHYLLRISDAYYLHKYANKLYYLESAYSGGWSNEGMFNEFRSKYTDHLELIFKMNLQDKMIDNEKYRFKREI